MKNESASAISLAQDSFASRHIGPSAQETQEMLAFLGIPDLAQLSDAAVPKAIRTSKRLELAPAASEHEALYELRAISKKNETWRSYIGLGYSGCLVPPVIQRNVFENPGWYTQYTPYQAEIAQGRLEALLNFQTMVMDLTGMEIANASLLDEATAAAEAMAMSLAIKGHIGGGQKRTFFVSDECYPQTIEVVRTRAEALGITVVVGKSETAKFGPEVFGVLLQYPAGHGAVTDPRATIERAHAADALVTMACDILALTILTPPGELGADIAVGSTQRFGVPLGFGGPHAAYFATRDAYKRQAPGRLVGVSQDVDGKKAVRLALQTREQHIRRDKATSNICTAQVLLANMAGFYAVYHGPDGLKRIAGAVHSCTVGLRECLLELGYVVDKGPIFDTIQVGLGSVKADAAVAAAKKRKINLRPASAQGICVSLDESVNMNDLQDLVDLFAEAAGKPAPRARLAREDLGQLARKSAILSHPVFNTHHSETEMLRYLRKLESKDLSLTHSMIPLGSCTMKLNATAEMYPVSWPEFAWIHPFAPKEQTTGYLEMITQLERMLCDVTGFAAFSLQPNAGSQGEYAGLLVIRRYHESRGDKARNVCLIPRSAHGTNPASAAMAGMKVVVVECDSQGNIDLADLKAKATEHAKDLSALMVTYPSTHGVFEEHIREVCEVVHQNGGQVYMDGANMNAQIGLCRPGDFGPDVCHLNLHKTFCIPHGGGGPGMGPIGVGKHLAPFLPGHPIVKMGGEKAIGPISAAPWGSASILPISWMYIRMMGGEGLTRATQIAILNANYMAKKLSPHFPLLYRGQRGLVAHECILDLRQFKETAGIEVEDVAKRLMDYGYHAPTVSFPVAGTVMIEPTESESKHELDRFCDAMIRIRQEIADIEQGKAPREGNVLKNAPHTAEQVTRTEWTRSYPRELAAYPAPWVRDYKFWPSVGRINAVLGDRNFICACPPIEDYE